MSSSGSGGSANACFPMVSISWWESAGSASAMMIVVAVVVDGVVWCGGGGGGHDQGQDHDCAADWSVPCVCAQCR